MKVAIVLDPKNPSYRRFQAKCYLEQGALASAREATAVAARLGDESAELAYVRGMIAERRLRHEEAVEHYWTAVGLEPGNVDYLLAAAESMVSAGLAEEAREVLDDGLEVLEGDERLLLMRARVCVVLDDLVQAAADYEAVEHLLAESPLAVGEWGRVLIALGQYARALATLRPLAELDTQSVNKQSSDERMPAFILRTLAECYIGVGTPEQSRKLLEEHLRRSPDDDRAWWLLAESFIRLAEWKEAERCVQRGEQLAPGRTDWKLLRAYLAGRDGNSAEAVELLETILAERPEDVLVRCFLARLYEKRGEIGRARAEFELVRNYDPTYPCVRSHFETKEIPEERSAAHSEEENTFDRFDSKGLPCRELSFFLLHFTSVFPQ